MDADRYAFTKTVKQVLESVDTLSRELLPADRLLEDFDGFQIKL